MGARLGGGTNLTLPFPPSSLASWRVTLVTLSTVPVMAGVTGWVLSLNQSKTSRDNAAYAAAGAVVYQVAANIRTILALNAADELIQRFESATEKAYNGATSQLLYLGIANGALMSSFMLAYIVVVYVPAISAVTSLIFSALSHRDDDDVHVLFLFQWIRILLAIQ
jgi:ABC-type bacteriocin/lantibiotic exporter with double-glycine peptidase domain